MTIGNLLVALLAFIAMNTSGMEIPTDRTPPVVFDNYIHLRASGVARPADPAAPRVKAFYDHRTEIISLDRNFDPANLEDRALLLHELLHWVQGVNGKNIENTCRGKLELPAYVLQRKYLRDLGKEDLAPGPLWIVIMAQDCSNLHGENYGF